MKTPRKITRVKLQIDKVNDYILLGVVSSEPDYKLSLSINRKLNISLKNSEPIRIPSDEGSEFLFSRFIYTGRSPEKVFTLVSNRSGKNFFIRRLKNIDYILYLHDPDKEISAEGITASLREIEGITAVFNIDASSVKDRNIHHITG